MRSPVKQPPPLSFILNEVYSLYSILSLHDGIVVHWITYECFQCIFSFYMLYQYICLGITSLHSTLDLFIAQISLLSNYPCTAKHSRQYRFYVAALKWLWPFFPLSMS